MASSQASGSESVGTSSRSKVYTSNDVHCVQTTTRNPAVWSNYDYCIMNDMVHKARCKKCGKFFGVGSNSTLRFHTNSCKATVDDPNMSQASIGPGGTTFIYDNEALREAFTKFVIQQSLPFNHFDNPKLTEIIKSRLQPRYQQVSRTTLRSDAIKLWKNAKNDIKTGFFEYKSCVSVTCDVWTAPHGTGYSYLGVTAHWFEPESWLLMKRTIAFKPFGYPHTGSNLKQILQHTLIEYNLADKVFSISLDNASNNNRAMELLKLRMRPFLEGSFFHSRCVAHIINIAIQKALKSCEAIHMKFKQLILTVYSTSHERHHNYKRFCKSLDAPVWGPSLDNNTRWNSTCIMFENLLRQKTTINAFNDIKLVPKGKSVSISEDEWEELSELTKFLQVFKTATTKLSGVYYPTSPIVLTQLYLMTEKFASFRNSPNPTFTHVVEVIKGKFVKYFGVIPLVFSCAAALNPSINVGGVEFLIESILHNLELTYGPDEHDVNYIFNQKYRFNEYLKKLFEHYATKYGQQSNPYVNPHGASSSRNFTDDDEISMWNNLRQETTKRQRSSSTTSELGQWMATDFTMGWRQEDFVSFDLLSWWKDRENQFPILSIMARDLFTVQASTVASESAFSHSGRIINDRRARLSPESVEVCVCLKDYLDGVDRIQDVSNLEGESVGVGVEETIHMEEVEAGISPPSSNNTDLDEGELEDFDEDDSN